MNLLGLSPYQKHTKPERKTNAPTKKQRKFWEIIRALGCMVAHCKRWDIEIHHCETGAGGRKDHDKVIPLCHYHHRGACGIHTIGRKVWQDNFGTEQQLMDKLEGILCR